MLSRTRERRRYAYRAYGKGGGGGGGGEGEPQDVYGERRCGDVCIMESELAFQPRVVELISIPLSFAVQRGARHGVPFSLEINKPSMLRNNGSSGTTDVPS